MNKEDLKGKFLIGFDTLCDGNQCGTDDEGNPDPILYDSYDEAFKELFIDALEGIRGNEEQPKRDELIAKMETLIEEDNIQKMKDFFDEEPDANYYDEFVQEADQFILGRKLIYGAEGAKVVGKKLEDL